MDTNEYDDSDDDTDNDVSIGFVVQSLLISQVMYTITSIIQMSEPNPKSWGTSLEFIYPYRGIPFLILVIIGIILSSKWIKSISKEIKSMIKHHDDKIIMIWNIIKILFHVLILEAIIFCPIMALPDVLPYDWHILDNVEGGLSFVPIGWAEYPLGSIIAFILSSYEPLQPSGNESLLY